MLKEIYPLLNLKYLLLDHMAITKMRSLIKTRSRVNIPASRNSDFGVLENNTPDAETDLDCLDYHS